MEYNVTTKIIYISVNLFIKKAFMLTRERFGMNPVAVSERYRTLGV